MDSYTELLNAEREAEEDIETFARPRPPERKKHYDVSKTTSHIQQVLSDMEPFFHYNNLTLEKDRQRYFSLAFAVLKAKGEPSLMSCLMWCRDRHVHIRAVNSVLSKVLK